MTGDATTSLHGGTDDRVAGVFRAVQVRDFFGYLLGIEQLTVHTVEAVGADPAFGVAHVLQGVAEVINPALGEHHVVVNVLRQAFPELHRVLIEMRRLVPQVVGTDNRCVARGVAATQPALFDYRDIGDAMLLGQVVCSGQAMPAATNNNHVVDLFRGRRAPHALPVFVMAERVFEEAEARVTLHSLYS
ncbi:hypothetical protein D3C79_821050 [compost metagenome]